MQALEAELRESISIMQEIKNSREEHERMKAEYKKMQEEVRATGGRNLEARRENRATPAPGAEHGRKDGSSQVSR
jgi:hypothetical protein